MGIPAQGAGAAPREAVPQCTSLREPTGGQREQSEIKKTWCWAGGSGPGWGGDIERLHSPQEAVGRGKDCPDICQSLLQRRK